MRTAFILLTVLCLAAGQTFCERAAWDCPGCGRKGNTGNFCGNCAHPAPEPENTAAQDEQESKQQKTAVSSAEEQTQQPTDHSELTPISVQRKAYAAGETVFFGHYEQDNNLNNGMEPIEWTVLDYDAAGEKVLLLSSYGLDAKAYQTPYARRTWEDCSLRAWLNSDFLNTAFSAEEKNAIILTHVDNSQSQGNSEWDTNGGSDTLDSLFLLSYQEVSAQYFKDDHSRRCSPSVYAVSQGAEASSYSGNCMWWLRSPGPTQSSAGEVYPTGSLSFMSGDSIRAVRPAIWLNLNP